jgi:uncharacterized caspase-like protein
MYFAAIWLLLGLTRGESAERVALVIGNSNYAGEAALRNPANDAEAVAAALQGLNFKVIKKTDLDLSQMEDAVIAFRRELTKGGLGLFFYAGHGLQVQGENYLVPIGARMREEYEAKRQCLLLGQVLDAMQESESNLNVVVLDCCRDNPFKRSWSRSNSGRGLAALSNTPKGIVVAYSTAPNETAADGTGSNSPYAAALAATLRSRPAEGLELRDVFFEAGAAVRRKTGQSPWINMETIDKYFLWRNTESSSTQAGATMDVAEKTSASVQKRPSAADLAGTTWRITDSDGEEYEFHFRPQGVLHYQTSRGLHVNGNWKQNGDAIEITMNDGFAVLRGALAGDTITGTATSRTGHAWNWQATMQ